MSGGGGDQVTICAVCQTRLPEPSRFCGSCGARVGALPAGPASAYKPASVYRPGAPPASVYRPGGDAGPSSALIADPLIGALIADRYRILSLLGRGGMGVVYKVEHAKIGKVMALKLLTGELARNRETVRRFKREAMLASRLSHPNTVQVFDYGSAGGLTYLAMEFLQGQDLGELLEQQGPLPFSRLYPIFLQICGSLREAHQLGIVHRDLKPENLFISRAGTGEDRVKVLDFGLAKLREAQELNEVTSSGMIVGTPYYMSPEQVRGEDVDHRGDIYALGALLYTCLTGTHAFEGSTPVAVLTRQLTEVPEAPHLRFPDLSISPTLSEIVLQALEKDPKARYQNIDEFEAALTEEHMGTRVSKLPDVISLPLSVPFEDDTATRDEVEQYERRLRRRNKVTWSILTLSALGAALLSYRFFRSWEDRPVFLGSELEPNDTISQANHLPFGAVIRGRLGQRIGPDEGDVDFYSVTVPAESGGLTHFSLSPLPNLAICAWIYRAGATTPLHRLCSGRAKAGLELPRFQVQPGDYWVAVLQDRETYLNAWPTYLIENVSDDYFLTWSAQGVDPEPVPFARFDDTDTSFETEPNSDRETATTLDPGASVRGALNFMRDQDLVCGRGEGLVFFEVNDAIDSARVLASVLQVTPLGGPSDKIPVRVHDATRAVNLTERDQKSPWRSPVVDLAENPCLLLELVPNPWAPTPHPSVAPQGSEEWTVRIERVEP